MSEEFVFNGINGATGDYLLPPLSPKALSEIARREALDPKLKAELEELETVGRPYITDKIAEARAHGDLRENAEYHAAKDEQGLMEARIRKIEHILQTAEIREPTNGDAVEVGSVVTVERDDGGTIIPMFTNFVS